jgi:predicted transcriptional regulator of viral defense system
MIHVMSSPTPNARTAGINRENRALLEQLHREMPGAFDVDRASKALGVEPARARKLLAYLARRGWLSRIRRGLYVAVPLDARRPGEWIADPWVVAERTFAPCYIGGWTACQHWGLTEQVFRTVLVVTAKKVRSRDQAMQGTRYHLAVRSENKFFGMRMVWRDQVRVQVSDPTRTIVDVLDDPTLGGGMRNVADVIHEYLSSEHRSDDQLVEFGDRLGNRAVFKRLGFVLEHLGIEAPNLVAACKDRRSAGLVALDPSVRTSGRIVRRWSIRANVTLGTPGGDW